MILYIGNNIKSNVEPMMVQLSASLSKKYHIKLVSGKSNVVMRMLHIIGAIFYRKKTINLAIIDTFSTLAFYYALISSIVLRFLGIPYIPILHGGNIERRFIKNPTMCKIIFNNSYCNVSPSKYLLDMLKKYGYHGKYIPNFIDINEYKYIPRDKCRPNLLWVRSFHSTYNPIMAIKVIKKLIVKFPNAMLCMVGPDKDGELEKCKKFAESEGISESIVFTGMLDKKEWIEMSSNYDIFLNTTNVDNMPVSVIESMALGLPIVSTEVGGIPYLINNRIDGLLVEKNNHNEMADTVQKLISDNKLSARISLQARDKSITFSKDFVISEWYKLIDSVLQN